MELYEAIEKHHAVRDFIEKPVSEETVKRILSAGLKAPAMTMIATGILSLFVNRQGSRRS